MALVYDMAVTRAALRELIDRLPDQEIESVTQLLLAYEAGDRLRISMLLAPEVEPDPGEVEALEEADRIDDGSRTPSDAIRRELGLDH